MKSTLKQDYENIVIALDTLYDCSDSDIDRILLCELEKSIYEVFAYFGMRTLKTDIENFKSGEVVVIDQDESGIWIYSLDHEKYIDISDMSPEELFY